MSNIDPSDIAQGAQLLSHWEALEKRRSILPWEWYEPSFPGKKIGNGKTLGPFANQLGFHRSPAITRLLNPGNGWGKTFAMAQEANVWGLHLNSWQETPKWPVLMVWFCPSYDQFEDIRVDLESSVFGPHVTYASGVYTWPDGSRLTTASFADATSWRNRMGINVDLILFDEPPPLAFWREMQMRRRGHRQTRFVIGATMTEPEHWTETELFAPWLEHYRAQGVEDETAALLAQDDPRYTPHPTTWLWHRGGVGDNVGQGVNDTAYYEQTTALMHPEERKVRLHGGWGHWRGSTIFDQAGLEYLRACSKSRGTMGMLDVVHIDPATEQQRATGTDVLRSLPAGLVGKTFDLLAPAIDGLRLEVWEKPRPGRLYTLGADFAHGRDGGDFDTMCILDRTAMSEGDGKARQVAEVEGRLGPIGHTLLYTLACWYNTAFIVGEDQGGGSHILPWLWTYYGYTHMYHDRDQTRARPAASQPDNPRLGWHRRANDEVWAYFRQVVMQRSIEFRSPLLVDQMSNLVWAPRSSMKELSETQDKGVVMKLRNGKSPDRAMAAAYAVFGLTQIHLFPQPVQTFAPGTMGHALGLDKKMPWLAQPGAEANRAQPGVHGAASVPAGLIRMSKDREQRRR